MTQVATSSSQLTGDSQILVTMQVDDQLFGIPALQVQDVLREQPMTSIPLTSSEIVGSINLRGRIVNLIDIRKRLQLADRKADATTIFVVVEHEDEYYSLVVDNVGEALPILESQIEKPPANLSGSWRDISTGVFRLDEQLLVVIDIKSLLNLPTGTV